jgi:hypothetical protein
LTLGKYEIDGLYIKLDKKLTLKANNIVIPKSKSKASFKNIDRTFDNIKNILKYFKYIGLDRVHFKNNEYKIIFTDDILYITSDDYEVAGNIVRVGQRLVADVSMLYIKKENINIVGKLTYFLKKDRLETEGSFSAYNVKGNFAAFKADEYVSFAVRSDRFTDLKTLISKTKLSKGIKAWIVDKVEAKSYKLYSLVGKGNISSNEFKLDFDSLRAEMLFDDVKIHFKDKLAPVLAKSFMLKYKDGGLYFDLKNPKYKNRDLNGSKVSIVNLIGKKTTTLILDLHIKSVIDSVVHKILKAYNLNIPVTQKGKKANVDIKIDIPLVKGSKKVSVFVNVALKNGDIYINKVKLPVHSGNVEFKKGFVYLKNVHLKDEWYDGIVNGKIDLKAKNANLKFNAKNISIGKKGKKFFILKNRVLPLSLNYANNIKIDIPKLKLQIENRAKNMLISIKDIKTIKPFIKDLALEISGGNLDITTKDFETYFFAGTLQRDSCFFYKKDNVCMTRVQCSGTITKKGVNFYAFNKRLHYNESKSRITLKNLNIDLKEFLTTEVKNKQSTKRNKQYVIVGKNSKIRYDKFSLVTDSYNIKVKPNGNINAVGKLGKNSVKLTKKGKIISIEALRMTDKMLHPLINFDGLKNGRYTFKSSGNPEKMTKGEIIIEGGIMSDFKAYNNTLAFINTLPALATFSSPGFSSRGFKIEEGKAKYRKIGDKIFLDSIYIRGKSATIVGKGELDLKKNTININMAIQTARELGKVVGSIPVLGYILMGDDKSMTVGLKITGNLKQPKVKTSATKELLSLPLDIIKRVFQVPSHAKKLEKEKQKNIKKENTPKAKKIDVYNIVAP